MMGSTVSDVKWRSAVQAVAIDYREAKGGVTTDEVSFGEQSSVEGGKAFLRSVLVPGWGQLSAGRKTTGYAFLASEIALVSGIIILRTHAAWLEDDYRQFARQHAGVSADRDHGYYVDIGNWMDRLSFNEKRLQDRQLDRLYRSSRYDWNWDSDAKRRHFKSMRIDSDTARQKSMLFVGGLLLNHLISAIEAGRTGSGLHLSVNTPGSDALSLNVAVSMH